MYKALVKTSTILEKEGMEIPAISDALQMN